MRNKQLPEKGRFWGLHIQLYDIITSKWSKQIPAIDMKVKFCLLIPLNATSAPNPTMHLLWVGRAGAPSFHKANQAARLDRLDSEVSKQGTAGKLLLKYLFVEE